MGGHDPGAAAVQPGAAASAGLRFRGERARELARLTGVLVSRSEKRAIFASEGGKPIVAEEGTRIGAYVMQTIEPGQVTVIGPEGQRTLQPAYDPKARQAGQPAGPARAGPSRPVLRNLGQPRVAQ